jgi:hypothetical protein
MLPACRLTLSGISVTARVRTGPFLTLFSLIHVKRAPLEIASIKSLDAAIHGLAGVHRYESETARATGLAVIEKSHLGGLSEFREETTKITLGRLKGDISHVHFTAHIHQVRRIKLVIQLTVPANRVLKSPSNEFT